MPSKTPSSNRAKSLATRSRGISPSACAALMDRWKNASISAKRSATKARSSRSCGATSSAELIRKHPRRSISLGEPDHLQPNRYLNFPVHSWHRANSKPRAGRELGAL
jgi:hypothetical protein